MRTTAEAEAPAIAESRAPRAARRGGRNPAEAEVVAEAPAPAEAEAPSLAVTTSRMLRVDEGIYVLHVGELAGNPGEVGGMAVPVLHVSAPFAEDGNGVDVVASFPRRGPWIGREGGTLVLRSPRGGGYVIATAYGEPGGEAAELALDLQRLDVPVEADAAGGARSVGLTGSRDVPTEILLHIERAGDRLFPGRGWVGALGRRMRIEAFSVRPLQGLGVAEIEMKGFLPKGAETQWVRGGTLCGTRGRGLPLVGFAVRIAPQQAERFEVLYQGSFFAGGISELRKNGDPCRATGADDPLEAVNIRIVERSPEAEAAETSG